MTIATLFAEFRIIDIAANEHANGPRQTKARRRLEHLMAERGQDHVRLVLQVLTDTHPASAFAITAPVASAVSDCIVMAGEVDGGMLDAFDAIDLHELQRMATKAGNLIPRRQAIAALLAERLGLLDIPPPMDAIRKAEDLAAKVRQWFDDTAATTIGQLTIDHAAKVFGISAKEIADARSIARLSVEARTAARHLGLNNSPRVLIAALRAGGPQDQVASLEDEAERRRQRREPETVIAEAA